MINCRSIIHLHERSWRYGRKSFSSLWTQWSCKATLSIRNMLLSQRWLSRNFAWLLSVNWSRHQSASNCFQSMHSDVLLSTQNHCCVLLVDIFRPSYHVLRRRNIHSASVLSVLPAKYARKASTGVLNAKLRYAWCRVSETIICANFMLHMMTILTVTNMFACVYVHTQVSFID